MAEPKPEPNPGTAILIAQRNKVVTHVAFFPGPVGLRCHFQDNLISWTGKILQVGFYDSGTLV